MGLPTVSESQLQRLSGSGVATATGDRTIGGGHAIYLRATWTNKRFTGQLCWLYNDYAQNQKGLYRLMIYLMIDAWIIFRGSGPPLVIYP